MKNLDLKQFVRSDLLKYEEYKAVPSVFDISVVNKTPIDKVDKLDANENLFGPSETLYKELSVYKGYQFYPDPQYKQLRKAIGKYLGISSDYIIVGSGGDELIDLFLRLILEPNDQIISAILKSVNNKTKLIILCSPNNPTGNITSCQDIKQILDTQKLVLVDEAYFEFSVDTVIPFIKKFPNLIILRSFSKWAGIAGLRLGYLIASPFLIKQLMKIKSPYNINVSAEIAGLTALKEIKYQQVIVRKIIFERKRLYKNIKKNPRLRIYPSFGNFLFIQVDKDLFSKLNLYNLDCSS